MTFILKHAISISDIFVTDGEFDEMVDSLNSGKIQYAYCRVTDPNTNLPKFVLVNWQGDGAPDTLKGRCAGHVRDIAALLRVRREHSD